eukprot:CAMPEP_0170631362 /NCGR_PEP_ID=MMETSP0224-20130122/34587_1 /TAXON_ID=285029 /ORGANISM="Togula jolla, Strain CCCM 725" /LENGTH=126 /DNA_ID=CAMNT_0010959669 /DNA_START=300 /DNA_END=677 /DNA_ORIENTATION=+
MKRPPSSRSALFANSSMRARRARKMSLSHSQALIRHCGQAPFSSVLLSSAGETPRPSQSLASGQQPSQGVSAAAATGDARTPKTKPPASTGEIQRHISLAPRTDCSVPLAQPMPGCTTERARGAMP